MAENVNVSLPEDITLVELHEFLVKNGWGMANDLMVRWPDQHPFLKSLIEREAEASKADLEKAKRLTIFILRDDCDASELQEKAIAMIAERFTIIKKIALDSCAQDRTMSMTRGGNWVEKYRPEPVKPIIAIICRNSDQAGPLPLPMSASKISKRYPHLENTDILIKRVIREQINLIAPLEHDRIVVHATDNPLDAVEALKATLGDDFREFMERYGDD